MYVRNGDACRSAACGRITSGWSLTGVDCIPNDPRQLDRTTALRPYKDYT